MQSPSELVAGNVRRLREERNMSMSELARRAGLAKGTLARLELGAANPTVDTLYAIARALEVPASKLISEGGLPVLVDRREAAPWVLDARSGSRVRPLGKVYGSGLVEVGLLELAGHVRSSGPHPPGTLEHVYVVAGRVRVGPLDDLRELAAGDSMRFSGDRRHQYEPVEGRCLLHILVTVPTAPEDSSVGGGPARG
ncbi:helix-turn-helix domain-containing protein [Pseudonocardia sp. H11422]|uniref:helix-turn-helix domain-containing protein n=1 Tax=Pseudonocardia sp. H11422 TaxID=2835866 RepID=UPI001BDCC699|nr:XRE family transcriptional regulator [Pseudonocardia sp. H11422]